SRRRHTRSKRDWSSDVCSSDLTNVVVPAETTLVLAPGTYGVITVGGDATLVLRGVDPGRGSGTYQIRSLIVLFRAQLIADNPVRSEERRVGKEGRCRWAERLGG